MRSYHLTAGDPLALTLAADARLCETNFLDDQIWELSLRGGEPAAVMLHSSLGLRARWVRLYPTFSLGGSAVTDPRDFYALPAVHTFFPNYLSLSFFPYKDIEAQLEYWLPASHSAAGRITLRNRSGQPQTVRLNWNAGLNPLSDGQPMLPVKAGRSQYLAGRCQDLHTVCALSGFAQADPGSDAALALDVKLVERAQQTITWAFASCREKSGAVSDAQELLTRRWDAEFARLQMLNTSQQVEISTGNDDWDAALAFSQKTAFRLFLSGGAKLPHASFVLSREPDHGFSTRGDGSDHPTAWKGQTALDAYYLAGLVLPGGVELIKGVLRNFLSRQQPDGSIEWRPGLGEGRGFWLAQPLLAGLAWQVYQVEGDPGWLAEVFPKLLDFIRVWFSGAHDRDGDGYPEWENAQQTGLEDLPLYDRWHPQAQGVELPALECPSLGAFLFHELRCLSEIARLLNQQSHLPWLLERMSVLKLAVNAAADHALNTYCYRDAIGHHSTPGGTLFTSTGPGPHRLRKDFRPAQRLQFTYLPANQATHPIQVILSGKTTQGEALETLQAPAWHWANGKAFATSQVLFNSLQAVELGGVDEEDQVCAALIDYTQQDLSLIMPLWAGMAEQSTAERILQSTLLPQFSSPYGLTTAPNLPSEAELPALSAVSPLWNSFILEGLIQYGYTGAAADLFTRLMEAAVLSLQNWNAFFELYDAQSAAPCGERNHLRGLLPVRLLLRLIGIQKLTQNEIVMSGFCPFPAPITVKYQGVEIQTHSTHAVITFPNGQSARLDEPGIHQIMLIPIPAPQPQPPSVQTLVS